MSKAGRTIVGIFDLLIGLSYLIGAFLIQYMISIISGILGGIPGGNFIGDVVFTFLHLPITVLGFVLLGIFWIILGIGLFMDQEWAVLLTKIMAILSLIGSIITCNCIGIILAIIILYLVKSEKKVERIKTVKERYREPDRRCTECGRSIPFDAVGCPYCGFRFKKHFEESQPKKHQEKKEPVEKINEDINEKIKEKETEFIKPDKESEKKYRFCPECGSKLGGSPKFCPECGKQL